VTIVPIVGRNLSSALAAAALIWSIAAGWRIWTTPVRYQTVNWSMDAQGGTVRQDGFAVRSFRDVSLLGAVPLIVPVALAGVALVAAMCRFNIAVATSALLFVLFVFVAGLSIGGAYVIPGAMLMVAFVVSLVDRARRDSGPSTT
jgi:hypothetical protein